MNLTLKALKIYPKLSEETNAFSATLCLDGRKVAEVRNDGRGGEHRYHWFDREAAAAIEAWAKTQPLEFDFDHVGQIVDELIEKTETLNTLKRRTKKETWFRLVGDEAKLWRTVLRPYDASVKQFLTNKYPNLEIIANEDLEKAVKYC